MNWTTPVWLVLLAGANVTLNLGWFGLSRASARPLWQTLALACALALVEYALALPAIRLGARGGLTLPQLKTVQLCLSLGTFVLVGWWLFGVRLGLGQVAGFGRVALGAALVFRG